MLYLGDCYDLNEIKTVTVILYLPARIELVWTPWHSINDTLDLWCHSWNHWYGTSRFYLRRSHFYDISKHNMDPDCRRVVRRVTGRNHHNVLRGTCDWRKRRLKKKESGGNGVLIVKTSGIKIKVVIFIHSMVGNAILSKTVLFSKKYSQELSLRYLF